jgi:hypothetical protein
MILDLTKPEIMVGKKFEDRDFSGQDFRGQKLTNCVFTRCNFDRAIMPEAPNGEVTHCEFILCSFKRTVCRLTNFAFSVFPGTVFDPIDMYGATVTLTCKLWENTHVGQMSFYLWLMLATTMRPVMEPVKEDLKETLIAYIGIERYLRLREMMQRRCY